ncbi:hypothetical protein [Sphingomonas sp. Leaf205]|uniref:hypothetical protein n=1 Tax=Sphingomonas sp. Leaf205 TaxID=2876551 RepID=UPI001E2AC0CF|nr:hypothetical protein [Sphingomonas sp. Leaf205]
MATALLEPRTVAANTSTRRSVIGFIGLLGAAAAAAAAAPAVTVASMPPPPTGVFAAYLASRARFNALPVDLELNDKDAWEREEAAYLGAYDELENAKPTNFREFAIWHVGVFDQTEWRVMRAQEILAELAAKEGR